MANNFYQAFAKQDSAAMNVCYSESASFSDPVFTDLSTLEVQGMWEMLRASARDFSLKY